MKSYGRVLLRIPASCSSTSLRDAQRDTIDVSFADRVRLEGIVVDRNSTHQGEYQALGSTD
jgi:hypothetical protein